MAHVRLLTIGVFWVAAGFAFAVWSFLDGQRSRDIERLVQRDIDAQVAVLARDLRARIMAVSQIAAPWRQGQAPVADAFYREAEVKLSSLPGLHALAYVNPDFIAQFVAPGELSWFEGQSVAAISPARRSALERARDERRIVVSDPVELADGSGMGFLIHEPIFSQDTYLGTLQIVINAEQWLSHLLFTPSAQSFMPDLSSQVLLGGIPLQTSRDFTDLGTPSQRTQYLQITGSSWQIEAKPRASFLASHRNTGPESIAAFVFVLVVAAGLLGLIARQAQLAQARAAHSALKLARTNRSLRIEAKERKRAEEAAEHARKVSSQFLATMNHEIRTPLNGILGMFQLIALSKDVPDTQKQQAQSGIEAARLLHRELSHMMDVAQLDVGAFEIDRQDTALAPCIALWRRHLTSLLRQSHKPIRGQCDVDANLPELARIDAPALGQVIENLLDNAVKFTDHGQVTLRIAQTGTALDIEVADTGPGVRTEDSDAIFERFYQSEAGAARHHSGSGLGLTISRDLVRLMGGELTLLPAETANTPDKVGARFRVRLPESLDCTPLSEVSFDQAGNA